MNHYHVLFYRLTDEMCVAGGREGVLGAVGKGAQHAWLHDMLSPLALPLATLFASPSSSRVVG